MKANVQPLAAAKVQHLDNCINQGSQQRHGASPSLRASQLTVLNGLYFREFVQTFFDPT